MSLRQREWLNLGSNIMSLHLVVCFIHLNPWTPRDLQMHRGQCFFLFQAATAQGIRGTGELRGRTGRKEGRAPGAGGHGAPRAHCEVPGLLRGPHPWDVLGAHFTSATPSAVHGMGSHRRKAWAGPPTSWRMNFWSSGVVFSHRCMMRTSVPASTATQPSGWWVL